MHGEREPDPERERDWNMYKMKRTYTSVLVRAFYSYVIICNSITLIVIILYGLKSIGFNIRTVLNYAKNRNRRSSSPRLQGRHHQNKETGHASNVIFWVKFMPEDSCNRLCRGCIKAPIIYPPKDLSCIHIVFGEFECVQYYMSHLD